MAFFCPIRVRKGKKKKGGGEYGELEAGRAPSLGGRITGSNSIETLVRVGLEKEAGIPSDSKMIVLHDFAPCVDDELEVRRGQIVTALYQENDWVYVIRDSDVTGMTSGIVTSNNNNNNTSNEGFIPFSYCTPVSSQLADIVIRHKKMPRPPDSLTGSQNFLLDDLIHSTMGDKHHNHLSHYHALNHIMPGMGHMGKEGHLLMNGSNAILPNGSGSITGHQLTCNSDSDPGKDLDTYSAAASDVCPFLKDPSGQRFIVLYNFIARDENDINVERGEFVTVLNTDDPDWYWILRSDGLEGFVPAAFLCSLDPDSLTAKKKAHNQSTVVNSGSAGSGSSTSNHHNHHNNNHTNSQGTTTGDASTSHDLMMTNHLHNHNNNNSTATTSLTINGHNNNNPHHLLLSGSHNNDTTGDTGGGLGGGGDNTTSHTEESTTYSNSIDGSGSQHGIPNLMMPDSRSGPGTGFLGDELVMLYDYKAQAPDDLTVRRGDWVYADLKQQKIDGWIWAFAPKLKKYGFIPKAYARPPAMTSI